jgi:hypothetical protein
VAFVMSLADGTRPADYVRDPAVLTDAERQLGESGIGAYSSITLDPVASQRESGSPTECAVNDVTYTCWVLVDRTDVDAEASNMVLKVGVAVNDLTGVTSPEDIGPKVPAYVVSFEVVPS